MRIPRWGLTALVVLPLAALADRASDAEAKDDDFRWLRTRPDFQVQVRAMKTNRYLHRGRLIATQNGIPESGPAATHVILKLALPQ